MNCVINDIIKSSLVKGKKTEVVRRYIRMKYNTNIDPQSFERRLKGLNDNWNFA